MKIYRRFSSFAALLSAFISLTTNAADSDPIRLTNSLPIMQGSGLSAPKSSHLNAEGWGFELNTNVQSHANEAGSPSETLILDGEVQSLSALLEWGFAERWQASLEIAAINNTAGDFDSLIDSWHDAFSLDDGDRDLFAQNQFRFEYTSADTSIVLDSQTSGLRDIEVGIAYQAIANNKVNLSLHADANLPVGNARKWLGSDKLDLSLSAALGSASSSSLGWHANLGVVLVGDRRLFGAQTERSIAFSSIGAHWQPANQWRWSAQIDAHQAVFESRIPELNKAAVQLALGVEYAGWQLYFAEDLTVNRAADFSLGLRWRVNK